MNIKRSMKESFVVIGKEAPTTQGEGFIQKLWEDANAHFHEVESMAKKMQMVRFLEYGEQCLISHVLICLGNVTLQKDYI